MFNLLCNHHRRYDVPGAPYLLTLYGYAVTSRHFGVIRCPQAAAVVDDFGDLVAVEPLS